MGRRQVNTSKVKRFREIATENWTFSGDEHEKENVLSLDALAAKHLCLSLKRRGKSKDPESCFKALGPRCMRELDVPNPS